MQTPNATKIKLQFVVPASQEPASLLLTAYAQTLHSCTACGGYGVIFMSADKRDWCWCDCPAGDDVFEADCEAWAELEADYRAAQVEQQTAGYW